MNSANSRCSTLGRVALSTCLLLLGLLLIPFSLSAQANLDDSGLEVEINFSGTYEDYIIPVNTTARDIVFFLNGGDGGRRPSCGSAAQGGTGSRIDLIFGIGTGDDELAPGSTLRFIVGEQGGSQTTIQGGGAGGGGGTAILYLKEGATLGTSGIPQLELSAADTAWVILAVAGGGGGAVGRKNAVPFVNCDRETAEDGTAARETTDGRGGGGNNAGGTDGQGGETGNNDDGGAGGGYLTDGRLRSPDNGDANDFSKLGKAGLLTGGAGGARSFGNNVRGGFGYGGGGGGTNTPTAADRGGAGGGGGFSGGGGGNVGGEGNNGGGAGSFVIEDGPRSVVINAGGDTNDPRNGRITYAFSGVFLDGTPISFDFDGAFRDFTVPAGIDTVQNEYVAFTMKGADGGKRRSTSTCTKGGGGGANVFASFDLGFAPGKVSPGGTLRLIVGEQGASSFTNKPAGAGGGGGTAVLYLPPGVVDDDQCPNPNQASLTLGDSCWTILAVAGGGGGAYTDGVCANGTGRSANDDTNGTGSDGDGANGLEGQDAYSTDFNRDVSGGGGGYRGGSTDPTDITGGAGQFTGSAGGSGSGKKIAGGFGYGGGGSGFNSGSTSKKGGAGGGGGYSGGGAIVGAGSGGGGGGSFVNEDYRESSINRSNRDLTPDDGFIIMEFPPSPPGAPVALCVASYTVQIQGDEDFDITPDLIDNGSYDVNTPALPLTYKVCREFDGQLFCSDDWGIECDNEFGEEPTIYFLEVSNGVAASTCSVLVEIEQGELGTLTCPDPVTVSIEDCMERVELEPTALPACNTRLSASILLPDGTVDDALTSFDTRDGRLRRVFPVGVSSITYVASAFDVNGEEIIQSCSVNVEVEGDDDITCPTSFSTGGGTSCFSIVSDGDAFLEYDGCAEFSYEIIPGIIGGIPITGTGQIDNSIDIPKGVNTVIYTVDLGNGETASCEFTIEIGQSQGGGTFGGNNPAPQLDCPDEITLSVGDGQSVEEVLLAIVNSVDDNCGITELTAPDLDLSCSGMGQEERVRIFAYDAADQETTCLVDVTLMDDLGVTCPEDQTFMITDGSCTTTVGEALVQPLSTYFCEPTSSYTIEQVIDGSPNVVIDDGSSQDPGLTLAIGTYEVTFTASNPAGQMSSCSYLLTILDDVAPEAVCTSLVYQLSNPISNYADLIGVNSTDNCGIASYALDFVPSCDNIGFNVVTLTVTDNSGNTDFCTGTIEVIDDVAPEITFCPESIDVQLDAGSCSGFVPDLEDEISATDNCGTVIVSQSELTGTIIGVVGATIDVEIDVFDASDSSAEEDCIITLIVVDEDAPSVTLDLTASGACVNDDDLSSLGGGLPLGGTYSGAGVTDNGDGETFTFSPMTAGVGIQTITYSFVGDNGCPTIAIDEIEVFATPTITFSALDDLCENSGVQTGLSGGFVEISENSLPVNVILVDNFEYPDGSITDNVAWSFEADSPGTFLVSNGQAVVRHGTGSEDVTTTFPITPGDIYYALDLLVEDLGAPVTGPDNEFFAFFREDGTLNFAARIDIVPPTGGGDFSIGISAQRNSADAVWPIDLSYETSYRVIVRYNQRDNIAELWVDAIAETDSSVLSDDEADPGDPIGAFDLRQSVSASNEIILLDNLAIGSTFEAVAVFPNLPATGIYSGSGVTDNGDGTYDFDPTTAGVGTHTITYSFTNNNGCTTTVSDEVEVLAAPIVSFTALADLCEDVGEQTGLGSGLPTGGVYSGPGVTDDGNGTTYSFDPVSAGAGTWTITYSFTDANGCTATASDEVVVISTPLAVCQDVTVALDEDGDATLAVAEIDAGSGAECSTTTVLSFDQEEEITELQYDCLDVGTETVTLYLLDSENAANESSCTAMVTVVDNTPPTANCISSLTIGLSESPLLASQINDGSTDNCTADQDLSLFMLATDVGGEPLGEAYNLVCGVVGDLNITLEVRDEFNNIGSCDVTVVVVDDIPPVATCQDIVVNIDNDPESITVEGINNGSGDNCGSVTLSLDRTDFGCADVGQMIDVTLSVSDGTNTSTCIGIVTVTDTTPPFVDCQGGFVNLDASGNGTLLASDLNDNDGSTDACGPLVFSFDEEGLITSLDFSCADVGVLDDFVYATDANGNVSEPCPVTIFVDDQIPPTVICAEGLVINLSESPLLASQLDGGSVDNCTAAEDLTFAMAIRIDDTGVEEDDFLPLGGTYDLSCSDVGTQDFLLFVSDEGGEESSCELSVNIVDDIAPEAVCVDQIVDVLEGPVDITPESLSTGSSDNCGVITMVTASQTTFDCTDVGDNEVLVTVSDGVNSSTCTAIVTVTGASQPVLDDITICDGEGSTLISPNDPGQIWAETFDENNAGIRGDCDSNDPNSCRNFNPPSNGQWTLTGSIGAVDDFFRVSNGRFLAQDVNGRVCVLFEEVDISDYSSVDFSASFESENTDANDYIEVTLIVDGVATEIPNWMGLGSADRTLVDDFGATTITQNGITGNTLQIEICVRNNFSSERYFFDDIILNGTPIPSTTYKFYDADPNAGAANLLAGPTMSYDPMTTVGTSPQSIWVVRCGEPCDSPAEEVVVTVNPLPSLMFTAPDDLCVDLGVQNDLGGATPTGGVYSGPGVTDDGNGETYSFDPAAAGVGTHTISYDLTDVNGCSSSITDDVEVFDVPVVSLSTVDGYCLDAPIANAPITGGSPVGGVYSGPGVTDLGNGQQYNFDPMAVGAGVYTVTYTFTDANGCTNSATSDIEVFDCAFEVTDPCACLDNATVVDVDAGTGGNDGQFSEVVSVSNMNGILPPNQIWTVIAATGAFDAYNIPAFGVQSAGVPVATDGSVTLTYDGVDTYELPFVHIDELGYSITIEGPFTQGSAANVTLTISNTCQYPNPVFDPALPDFICSAESAITLAGTDTNGGTNDAITFTIDGMPATAFDPLALGVGFYTVVMTYDGADDGNGGVSPDGGTTPASPGCLQTVQKIVEVGGLPPILTCPTDDFGLPMGCNPTVPDAATTFNLLGDPNPDPALPTVEDGCGTLTLTSSDATSDNGCIRTVTRTYTITDQNGDSDQCVQTFTFTVDTDSPTFNEALPMNMTVECDAVPMATVLTASDNCTPDIMVSFNEVRTDGACPQTYTLTRTWTTEADDCGNPGIVHIQVVNVQDTTSPTFNEALPGDITVECDAVPTEETLSASDNCDTDVPVSFNETRTDGPCPQTYTLTRVWSATDDCGNPVSHTQVVTVQDTTSPTFNEALPMDMTVECDAVPMAAVLTAMDNCDPEVPVSFNEVRTDTDCPQEYLLTRTWSAQDDCGNPVSHTQRITVEDTTPPVPMCNTIRIFLNEAGMYTLTQADVDAIAAGASDNCDDDFTYSIAQTIFNCDDIDLAIGAIGGAEVEMTFEDCAGNTSMCTAIVEIDDSAVPFNFGCIAEINVTLDEECSALITPDMLVTGFDDCIDSYNIMLDGQDTDVLTGCGDHTYMIELVEDGEVVYTCWGEILAEDKADPVVICQDDVSDVNVFFSNTRATGTLDATLPTLDFSTITCLTKPEILPGEHPYEVFTTTTTVSNGEPSTVTYLVGGELMGGSTSGTQLYIYQGAFDPEHPCQNIFATSASGELDAQYDPYTGSITVELPALESQLYTFVVTNDDPAALGQVFIVREFNDQGNPFMFFSDEDFRFIGGRTLGVRDLVCSDINELLVDEPVTYIANPNFSGRQAVDDRATRDLLFDGDIQAYNAYGLNRRLGMLDRYLPQAFDNCNRVAVTVSTEHIVTGDCAEEQVIVTYTATEFREDGCVGDERSVSCTQVFTVRKPTIDDVFLPPSELTIECDQVFDTDGAAGGPDENPRPSYAGAPWLRTAWDNIVLDGDATYCNLGVTYSDSPRIELCEGGYSFVREWSIQDWCDPASNLLYSQVIKVKDYTGPELSGIDETIHVSASPLACVANILIPTPDVTDGNGCSSATATTYTVLAFGETFFAGGNVGDGDIVQAPIGTHTLIICAEDDCLNETCEEYTLVVTDQIEPNAICDDELNVSIGGGDVLNGIEGIARVFAEDIDEGSNDNCGSVTLEVRRNFWRDGTCDASANRWSPWGEFVDFYCCDIASVITIELRVTDESGNQNTCWMTVTPEDKLNPFCYAPQDVTLDCNELPLTFPGNIEESYDEDFGGTSDLMNAIFGSASGTDNCAVDTIVERTPNININECGWGSITRRFEAWQLRPEGDVNGNGAIDINEVFRSTNSCSQSIIINEVHDFTIDFPEDADADCGDPEVPTVITSTDGCDVLSVNIGEPVLFTATGDECYKYSITYDVINWCLWDGEYTGYVIPRMTEDDGESLPIDRAVEGNERPVVTYNDENGLCIDRRHSDRDGDSFLPNCDSPTLPNYGRYIYTQFVKVYDSSAPVVSVGEFGGPTDNCPDLLPGQFGDDDGNCEETVSIPFSVMDECELFDNDGNLVISIVSAELDAFAVDASGDGQIQSSEFTADFNVVGNITDNGDGTYSFDGTYPIITEAMGDNVFHAVRILLEDGCGNQTSQYITFDVIDCKGPAPICINGLTVTLMPNEEGTGCEMAIWASDFEGSPIYDCTGEGPEVNETGQFRVRTYAIYRAETAEQPGFEPSPDDTGLILNQDDDPETVVYVYAFDEEGNYDFCETYVLVQAHASCEGGETGTIAGIIATEEDETVEGVEVNLNGLVDNMMVTGTDGTYAFNNLPLGGDYTVTPYLNANPLNGVTTFDLIKISQHVLNVDPLDSPYKMIAADANRSNTITTLDLIQIRKLILNITTEFPNNTSWRFVDQDHDWTDVTNPWVDVFPELISENDLAGDLLDADFVGVKIGDVNGSAQANALASDDRNLEGIFHLQAEDIALKAGNTYTVAITGENLSQIRGYQGTLQIEGAELIDIEYALAEAENFGLPFVDQGLLTMSWNRIDAIHRVGNADVLFSLVIQATDNRMLSEVLSINDRYTISESYRADQTTELGITFADRDALQRVFTLYQNSPNPFREGTLISFNLPEDSKATLTISDASGQVLQVIRGEYAAGYNTINITKRQLQGASGVLSYTLETAAHKAARQMIVVE